MESISFFDDLVAEELERRKSVMPPEDEQDLQEGLIEKLLQEGKLGWRQHE